MVLDGWPGGYLKFVTTNVYMSPTISPWVKCNRVCRSQIKVENATMVKLTVAPVENSRFTTCFGRPEGLIRVNKRKSDAGTVKSHLVIRNVILAFVDTLSVRAGLECVSDTLDVRWPVG